MNYSRDYYNPSYTRQTYPPYCQKLPQSIEYQTRSFFEAIERFAMTCNGVAHALESTLIATHSGFAALLQLTRQFHTIKHSVGQVFGLVSLLRWLKNKTLKNNSCRNGARRSIKFSLKEFESFNANRKTPWIMYIALSIGVSLIIHLYQQQQQRQKKEKQAIKLRDQEVKKKITPPIVAIPPKLTKLDFARAIYSFQAESPSELSLQPNDLIAILSKEDDDWWHGRLKNGKVGYFPASHVEIIERNIELPLKPTIAPSA